MQITENITITNEDCMDLLSRTPDKYYELAICDPPYGIGEGTVKIHSRHPSQIKYSIKEWDNDSPDSIYFNELIRTSKNQIIWGANHFISKIPYDSSCWIVWDKDGYSDQSDCEIAWTSFKTAVRKYKYTWNGFRQEDMKNKEIRFHPTQKPVALYKWLLHNYAKEGDKILDTHLGSGSIAIACHDYKFNLTACELDKEYYDKAVRRVKDHVAQLTLF
jgi:site-specific DNA-methyltransferase (adenine-specific)